MAAAKPLDSDGVGGHAPIENGVGGGNGGLVRRPRLLNRLSLMIEPLFARDVATLDDEATSALDLLLNGMASDDRGWHCRIWANADPRERNPASLAAARGQAVRAYALGHVGNWVNVDPVQIDQHRCTDRSDACGERNRRVIVQCQG